MRFIPVGTAASPLSTCFIRPYVTGSCVRLDPQR
jgi:hypothetical protein